MKQNTYILVNGTVITMEAYRESYGRDLRTDSWHFIVLGVLSSFSNEDLTYPIISDYDVLDRNSSIYNHAVLLRKIAA